MKALLIAEKPSLLKKIMSAYSHGSFDFELDGVAQVGHLFGLKSPKELNEETTKIITSSGWDLNDYPWFPKEWGYKITDSVAGYSRSKAQIYNDIKKKIHSGEYDFIIHAGDPDQEGELLVRETLLEAKNTLPVKRIWINASTEEEFIWGLKNLKPDSETFYEHMYEAALARQHADYLIGMNFSPVVTIKTGQKANVGRLKTFITALVSQRDKQIEDFVPSSVYEANLVYNKDGIEFLGSYTEKFETEKKAEEFLSTLSNESAIKSVEVTQQKTSAPSLFKLSSLQISAGKKGYSAKDIQEIAQSLYDKEYLSYPRTSCEYLSDKADFAGYLQAASAFSDLQPYIDKIDNDRIESIKKNKKYVRNDKVENSGHVALTPIKKANLGGLSEKEADVLHMICRQYVAIFLDPQVSNKTKIITENSGNKFVSSGKKLISKGYTELLSTDLTDIILPELKKDEILPVQDKKTKEIPKTCPSHYTDATLIEALEHPAKYIEDEHLKGLGKVIDISIGQPSTRAPILNELVELGYLEHKRVRGKEQLVATQKGKQISANLSDCTLVKADTTAAWEEKLEKIRSGKMTRQEFEDEIHDYIASTVKELKEKDMVVDSFCSCKWCGGTVIDKGKLYSCTKCDAVLWKDNNYLKAIGTKLTPKMAEEIFTKGKTFKKGLKSKKGNSYDAFIVATPGEKTLRLSLQLSEKERIVIGKCPKCGKEVIETPKAFSCEDRSCGFALWKDDKFLSSIGAKMTRQTAKALLDSGEVLLNSLTSRKGKKYSATIQADFLGKYVKYNIKF